MTTASAVIVGGGVMGASAAFHLAQRGWRDLVILDRGHGPGEGSTGKATGGFRAQFTTAIGVRLSLLARRKLLRFRDETGVDPEYRPAGYLFLASTERERSWLRAALEVQHAAGLAESAEVSPEEAARLNPHAWLDGVIGGSFCSTDGFLRPLRLLEGYLAAAARLGVRIEWSAEVSGLELDPRGRITAVRTTRESIATGAVVNAAGPWATAVANLAGVDLPVTALRREVAATIETDALPADMPMTVYTHDGFHVRVRDRRALLIWPSDHVSDEPLEAGLTPRWVDFVSAKARSRFPALRDVPIDLTASWAGYYEMSPDRHAILGPARECENLFLINGSSGHGVMHSPALGQLLAEIMSDGKATSLDVSELRHERFAEGKAIAGAELL